MEKVCSVSNMRESDAYTIEHSVSGRELMLRAGKGVFDSYGHWGRTAIICGSGNNAGDGYVLALLLNEKKIPCTIFTLKENFSPDGKYYFDKCTEAGIPCESCSQETDFSGFDTVVDCIFGTGFKGSADGLAEVIIDKINMCGSTVISVDINSGLCGDNGLTDKCVVSDLTVSVGSYKTGHFLGMAKDKIKKLCNTDIGIELRQKPYLLLEDSDFAGIFRKRDNLSNKGTYGYVGIMGGCTEYSGAVKLANMSASALRAGCGVARLIIPKSIVGGVMPYILESTLCPMDDNDGHIIFDRQAIDTTLSHLASLAVGMGWGRGEDNEKILSYILESSKLPIVIDADGLNSLSKLPKTVLHETCCKVVLTPHLKEFERLSGVSAEEILSAPIIISERFAKENRVILLLKGPTTVVTDGTDTYLVNRGCAGMASAGSGDVLSGVIAGLLGYCECSARTVASAAHIAGLAGEIAQEKKNPISMTASDTAACIGEAVGRLIENSCAI